MTVVPLLLWLSLSAPPVEPLRISLPLPGWSAAESTQLVVERARPDVPVLLRWLGWDWTLWPNAAGRAAVSVPLVPQRNVFEVEQLGKGREAVAVLGTGVGPDLLVAVDWDPGARFDLQVTDPAGEVCESANRRTTHGGVRLRDDPEAPGPHVFLLSQGQAGEYRIAVACGRLPAGRSVRVRTLALVQPGTAAEERLVFSMVVTRCDEVAELGTISLVGRPARP